MKLIDITGKAISGEWGNDCEDGNGIPVLRTTNFTDTGVINFANVVLRDIPTKDLSKKFLRPGDIIIEKSGGSDTKPVGRVVYFDSEENKYLINNFTGLLRVVDQTKWYPRYVFYALFANYSFGGTRQYENKTTGLHNLKLDQYLNSFDIPDVDFQLQHHIADTLDKVSEGIEVCRKMLGKLDLMVKAKFGEMFGDPIINPMHYPVHQLAEYIRFLTSGSRGWAKYYSDEGEWFITIKNVKNCNISVDDVQCITPPQNAEANRTRLKEGDLLISITADLGRTGVVTKEIAEHGAYNNQHLTCIRLDQSALVPLYVAYFMESSAGKAQFEAKNMSAVKAGLNFDAIRSLKLIVPPLEQQNQFVLFVTQIKKSQLTIRGILDKMEMEKLALMQEYFG